MAGNEELFGYVALEDGSNYDPSIPSPSWGDVIRFADQAGIGRHWNIQVVVGGKINYNPKRTFDAKTVVTTIDDIIRSVNDVYGVTATKDTFINVADNFPDATEILAGSIMNLAETPEKVTFIIIRSI